MAGVDRILDPLTRDYVLVAADGSWSTTRSARTSVYHSILAYRGRWVDDAEFGSRLNELSRAKNTIRMRAVIADMITEALQMLIEAGRISRDQLVTATLGLSEAAEAIAAFNDRRNTQVRVAVNPWA